MDFISGTQDHIEELGNMDAPNCPELDMVLSQVRKVERWKQRCHYIAGTSVGDETSQFSKKIKDALDGSLYIFSLLKGCKARDLCTCCSRNFEDQTFLTCSMSDERYHQLCKGQTVADTNDLALCICHYCHFFDSGKISQNGGGPLAVILYLRCLPIRLRLMVLILLSSCLMQIFEGKRAELKKLIELLSDAVDFYVWIEERSILSQLVEQALPEVVDFVLTYHDEALSIVVKKLSAAMKAMEVAAIFDHQGSCNFELASARNSWRVRRLRTKKLFGGPQKPLIQQIQRHLKEGLTIRVPPEGYFWQELAEVEHICTQWAEKAKVLMDSGTLGLENVFQLIMEGENLHVQYEKELKFLRD